MSDDDFDVESLAQYLHLATAKVARLADRGNLPGRKVQGVWRFAHADIHHWLEARIGLSDDEELVQMETILRSADAQADEAAPAIAQLLSLDAIEVPLAAKTRGSVIQSMADVAARTGLLWDPQKMAEAVRAREEMQPTALETGVALLHPRRPMASILGGPLLAFGRTERGIPFGGSHGTLTDLYFLICSVDDRGHLRTLARLSRLLAGADFLTELRGAADARAVHVLIHRVERVLS